MSTVTRTLLTTGAMFIGVAAAAAQAPAPRPAVLTVARPPTFLVGTVRSSAVVIERLASFDGNADGRISRDELPERMQDLVARGDKNADGALDLEEIRALVTVAASDRTRLAVRPPPSEGFPGVISDLKLPPAKHQRALAIVGAHPPPRNINDPSNSALLGEMRVLLDDQEYEDFVAAATRLSRSADLRFRIVGGVVQDLVKAPSPR